jgi:hypothetical protein
VEESLIRAQFLVLGSQMEAVGTLDLVVALKPTRHEFAVRSLTVLVASVASIVVLEKQLETA